MALWLLNFKLTLVDKRKPWEKTPKNESKDWTKKNVLKKNRGIILWSVFIFNLIGSEVFYILKILFFQINTRRTNSPQKNNSELILFNKDFQ